MKRILLPALLALTLLLSACSSTGMQKPDAGNTAAPTGAADSAGALKITAEEAYDKMNGEEPVVVVDVRTAEEYAENHIPGAILLPNEDIGDTPPAQLPVMNADILIYCRSGNRSAQAAEKLSAMGYTRINDFGGIKDWPYETESGEYLPPEKEGLLSSFSAHDLNGVPRDETVFSGYKLTMINIWATFCGPCLREMPELGKLAKAYAESGVQIIGVVVDVPRDSGGIYAQDMVETAQSLVAETGADYLHLLPSADLYSAKLVRVTAVPETIFVDSKGQLVGESYVGSRSGGDWAKIIDSLLDEVSE